VAKLREDSQMPPTERLGLSQPGWWRGEQPGQVVEVHCDLGMIRAEALFVNG
jgi:hypothetical protein